MSDFAEYLRERTSDQILENNTGFCTYRFMPDGVTVYIVDLYVKPEFRKLSKASGFADYICMVAKERGCTTLIGSVVPSNKGSTDSLKVLLAYGMSLMSSSQDMIFFRKEIL